MIIFMLAGTVTVLLFLFQSFNFYFLFLPNSSGFHKIKFQCCCPVHIVYSSLQPHGLKHTRLLCPPLFQSLLKFMSAESVVLSNHLILCQPLLLLPSTFPSIRVFFYQSGLHIMWPNYWSFSFSNSPFNEYSGLISFWINWFDLLAVQGTLKSLLQHHNSKASLLQCSAFLMV